MRIDSRNAFLAACRALEAHVRLWMTAHDVDAVTITWFRTAHDEAIVVQADGRRALERRARTATAALAALYGAPVDPDREDAVALSRLWRDTTGALVIRRADAGAYGRSRANGEMYSYAWGSDDEENEGG